MMVFVALETIFPQDVGNSLFVNFMPALYSTKYMGNYLELFDNLMK